MNAKPTRDNALDHVVVVLFENRSFDNLLGHLYGPDDATVFEGVIGKDLSNPIPDWAEHGAERKAVPFTVGTDMDSPNPDPGEEWYHANTQLFGVLDDHNRFKIGEEVTTPWNAPSPGATPTMDGFVADYISTFTGEIGRQPTYEEYAQIMTGFTPEQLPVLNGIARDFGVFDHWFSEVPSQTFMNRSFWTAATSSGLVVNAPATKWFTKNDAETIFERLEQHGRTWKIYVMEPMPLSFHGIIHFSRLKDRLATNVVPFAEFERDAAAGTLPDFSFIEPNFISGHGDYHPAFGRSFIGLNVDPMDPPSSMLAGEAFLARIFDAYRAATSASGTNVWNTALLIGWDEPGGTYDHVPPGTVPPPDPAAPPGELGFAFDRSGYRVPAILVSPWVPQGAVFNDEFRHTSLIATLRKRWSLGAAFTQRDASARTFDDLFTLDDPREPETWATITALPVPAWHLDEAALAKGLSTLGKTMGRGVIAHARELGLELPSHLDDPDAAFTSEVIVGALREISWHFFPLLRPHSTQTGGADP
ncbi:MAG TPA: alkaline phosphatase family protein [Actinomycetota bacterium]|nr:alkaline phosphatase family protein [Actinomycetota bacterium]